jgi:hypothetical protein
VLWPAYICSLGRGDGVIEVRLLQARGKIVCMIWVVGRRIEVPRRKQLLDVGHGTCMKVGGPWRCGKGRQTERFVDRVSHLFVAPARVSMHSRTTWWMLERPGLL